MQRNIHKPFTDPTIPSKLKFVEMVGKYVYMLSPNLYTSPIEVADVCVISEASFGKMVSLLKGSDTFTPSKSDKLYVLPDSKIPGYKIKEYCRSKDISIVTDIEKATCVLGTEKNMLENGDYDTYKYQIPDACFASKGDYKVLGYDETTINFIKNKNTFQTFDVEPETKIGPTDNVIISGALIYEFNQSTYSSTVNEKKTGYLMTAEGVELVYNILSKKLPVLTQEHFISTCSDQLPFDQQMFDALDMMYSSPSDEDSLTASKILFNTDCSKSTYLLWKLVKKHYYDITNSENRRLKEGRLFIDSNDVHVLYNYDYLDILSLLTKKDQVTRETYNDLMSSILIGTIEDANRRFSNQLSVLDIQVTAQNTYDEYMKKHNPNYVQVQDSKDSE